jgi:hypothetical protein
MMNGKGYGRKWPWPELGIIPTFVWNPASSEGVFLVSSRHKDGGIKFLRNFTASRSKEQPPLTPRRLITDMSAVKMKEALAPITITVLDIIHRPALYVKLNSTL